MADAVLAYPYKTVSLTKADGTNKLASLENQESKWSFTVDDEGDITFKGDSVTAGVTASLNTTEIKRDVISLTTNRTFQDIDRTSLADSTMRIDQGREQWEASMSLYLTTDTDDLIHAPAGKYFLFAQRPNDSSIAALVTISVVAEQQDSDSGRLTYDLTLKNASAHAPEHEGTARA